MSNDKIRAEFEAWANSFFSNAPTKYKRDALPKDDPNYGDYVSKSLQVAWLAWQASRAALEIELPDRIKKETGYSEDDEYYNLAIDRSQRAIEAAGARVKA